MNEVVFGIIIEFQRFVTNIDEPEADRAGDCIKWLNSDVQKLILWFLGEISSIGRN